jgi:hypothetical protein
MLLVVASGVCHPCDRVELCAIDVSEELLPPTRIDLLALAVGNCLKAFTQVSVVRMLASHELLDVSFVDSPAMLVSENLSASQLVFITLLGSQSFVCVVPDQQLPRSLAYFVSYF